jgi:hypothetical protein
MELTVHCQSIQPIPGSTSNTKIAASSKSCRVRVGLIPDAAMEPVGHPHIIQEQPFPHGPAGPALCAGVGDAGFDFEGFFAPFF